VIYPPLRNGVEGNAQYNKLEILDVYLGIVLHDKRKKLDAKSHACIIVGYSIESKSCKSNQIGICWHEGCHFL
jgi:hypothetical protein